MEYYCRFATALLENVRTEWDSLTVGIYLITSFFDARNSYGILLDKPAQSTKDGHRDTMHITLRYTITM